MQAKLLKGFGLLDLDRLNLRRYLRDDLFFILRGEQVFFVKVEVHYLSLDYIILEFENHNLVHRSYICKKRNIPIKTNPTASNCKKTKAKNNLINLNRTHLRNEYTANKKYLILSWRPTKLYRIARTHISLSGLIMVLASLSKIKNCFKTRFCPNTSNIKSFHLL